MELVVTHGTAALTPAVYALHTSAGAGTASQAHLGTARQVSQDHARIIRFFHVHLLQDNANTYCIIIYLISNTAKLEPASKFLLSEGPHPLRQCITELGGKINHGQVARAADCQKINGGIRTLRLERGAVLAVRIPLIA